MKQTHDSCWWQHRNHLFFFFPLLSHCISIQISACQSARQLTMPQLLNLGQIQRPRSNILLNKHHPHQSLSMPWIWGKRELECVEKCQPVVIGQFWLPLSLWHLQGWSPSAPAPGWISDQSLRIALFQLSHLLPVFSTSLIVVTVSWLRPNQHSNLAC